MPGEKFFPEQEIPSTVFIVLDFDCWLACNKMKTPCNQYQWLNFMFTRGYKMLTANKCKICYTNAT